jgi:hypothetical protein
LETYVAHTGQDAHISFTVDVLASKSVDVAVSIEQLRIGIGWEIVLISNSTPVADLPGRYMIKVVITKIPLAPGKYSLNLFLSKRKEYTGDEAVSFDLRSWTTGNGLSLEVQGTDLRASAKLPFVARPLKEPR